MLTFLRTHQKYFFVVITIVIVLSFSFFGTYSTLPGNSIHEQVAFKTVTGEEITRGELEEMAAFIGTDSVDSLLYGGFGPNFLNDGVIRKDFLESGLALVLIQNFSPLVEADLQSRFAKEKGYKPYQHPQAKFLSSQTAWNYFAPSINANLRALQASSGPLSEQALDAKIQLFLAEKSFSAPYLSQALRYQEKQYGWVQHDPALDNSDLSLFGYHTVEDWFGPKFNRIIAEFIFNAADIATEKGYRVTKEEALADLMKNATDSFNANKSNPSFTASSVDSYLEHQLYRMRLDKSKAAKIWQRVLLFRTLFNDISNSMFVDTAPYETFNRFANEVVRGDLYELPKPLRFSDFKTLQRFETYLDAVSKRSKEEKNLLTLPETLLSVDEIAKKTPELVRKNYEVMIKSVNKNNLQAKVSLKDTLNYELDEKGFNTLKSKFPELALNQTDTRERRLEAIESLDPTTRQRVDQFARKTIVDEKSEWIEEALSLAKPTTSIVSLSSKGQNPPFIGLEKGEQLIALLDKAPLNEETNSLKKITFDGENYYNIILVSKDSTPHVLTFEEANRTPILDTLLQNQLEVYYTKLRTEEPAKYQNSDKSWKPFSEVQDLVSTAYFEPLFKAIQKSIAQEGEPLSSLSGERLSPYRFYQTGKDLLKKVHASQESLTVAQDEKPTFQEQFKWVRSPLNLTRKEDSTLAGSETLFQQAEGSYSKVIPASNGHLYFAKVEKIDAEKASSPDILKLQVERARFILGSDAEKSYTLSIIPLLKEKNAISFDYQLTGEEIEPENELLGS